MNNNGNSTTIETSSWEWNFHFWWYEIVLTLFLATIISALFFNYRWEYFYPWFTKYSERILKWLLLKFLLDKGTYASHRMRNTDLNGIDDTGVLAYNVSSSSASLTIDPETMLYPDTSIAPKMYGVVCSDREI